MQSGVCFKQKNLLLRDPEKTSITGICYARGESNIYEKSLVLILIALADHGKDLNRSELVVFVF